MLDNYIDRNSYQTQFSAVQPNLNNKAQIPMEAAEINPELLKENIQDTYIANRVTNTTDDPKAMMATGAAMIPTWFVLTQAMDKFAKNSRGEWQNTIQHKIANFGDNIANSSFVKSSPTVKFGQKIKSLKNYIKTKILDKSRITRAILETPSIPENSMARANHIGMTAMQLFDYPQHGTAFTKPLKSLKDLDCYGASKEEIQEFIRNKTPIQEAEYKTLIKNSRNQAQARILSSEWATANVTQKANILKDLKAFEWGYKNFADMEELTKHTHNNIEEIFKATKNANQKMFARIWGSNQNKLSKISTKVFGREVYASETLNKLFAELGNIDLNKPENAKWKHVLEETGYMNKLPKSSFAKALNKYTHLIMEGATNRVAGGKFVAVLQSWFLAEAIYKAATSDGGIGEKGKVFAERVTELIALFACIPLALKMMHSLGGMQYAGMTKEQVTAYRDHLKKHNLKSASGGYATKAEWAKEDKLLKEELKANVKNLFVKLAKKIGRIITVGLEQRRPWDKKDITEIINGEKVYRNGIWAKIKDLFKHPKFGLKQISGYPMRIILGMAIIMPILSKTAVKICHALVGKPQHSLLDEEKEQEELEKSRKVEMPDILKNTTEENSNEEKVNIPQAKSNLLNQHINGIPYNSKNEIKSTNYTKEYPDKQQEPIRTYIPSPIGVQVNNNEDLTQAELALERAQTAEQTALETLKLN